MSGISKRVSGSWVSGDYGIMKTATDTITTLPAVLYPNDITATVGLKGNMSQTGTPTPQNPIQPSECGDLETVGEKAGQYKIPISSGGVTTDIYLGSTQTTRKIKKLVLDGTENWQGPDTAPTKNLTLEGYAKISGISCVSTHYNPANNVVSGDPIPYDSCCFYIGTSNVVYLKGNESDTYPKTITDFKAYLAQQYANGTPVTIWYVLAEPTTDIVNEPIRKIGNYADTVSGITIPTIAGADSFDVLTTLKPSEVTANYHGWHTGAVHERDSGQWQ